jgi:nitrate reductase gamma subunit
MTLLSFARGPGMQFATLILIAGMFWRLAGVLLLRRRVAHAAARNPLGARLLGGAVTVFTRSIPRRTFWPRAGAGVALSYVFHIGLFIVLFGGAPHILIIHEIFGVSWPDLPKGMIVLASGITLAALILLLLRRLTHPVLKLLSTPDDYISWLIVFMPVATGILLSGETVAGYGTLLALHILSIEALMIWLPFGKLMHVSLVFAGRFMLGYNFSRKGAAT